MTTEVEGTCVAVEDKTEADWAMDYAEERARRVKAERRLAAMAFALGGLIKATHDTIEEVMRPIDADDDKQAMRLTKELASLVMEAFDAELMANLLTFDPPWGIAESTQEALITATRGDDQSPTHKRLMKEHFTAMNTSFSEAWHEVLKEWELICQQNDLNATEDVRATRQLEFSAKVMVKAMADKKLEQLMKEITKKEVTH
jgi:hypothetical protein